MKRENKGTCYSDVIYYRSIFAIMSDGERFRTIIKAEDNPIYDGHDVICAMFMNFFAGTFEDKQGVLISVISAAIEKKVIDKETLIDYINFLYK